MDIKPILDYLGEKTSDLSTLAVGKLSDTIGQEPNVFVGKIVTMIILVGLIFLGSKITNKAAKFILIILSVLLVIAVAYTFI